MPDEKVKTGTAGEDSYSAKTHLHQPVVAPETATVAATAQLADAPEGLVQRVHDAGMLLCLRAADTREKVLNMIAAGLDYMPTNKVTPAEVRP